MRLHQILDGGGRGEENGGTAKEKTKRYYDTRGKDWKLIEQRRRGKIEGRCVNVYVCV